MPSVMSLVALPILCQNSLMILTSSLTGLVNDL